MFQFGFKEDVEGYGNVFCFIKKVGFYEIVVVVLMIDDIVCVEVYGNDKKVFSFELESIFEDVEVEEFEIYDFEDSKEERFVINFEILKNEEKFERKIVEVIKMIENMLMVQLFVFVFQLELFQFCSYFFYWCFVFVQYFFGFCVYFCIVKVVFFCDFYVDVFFFFVVCEFFCF